jgi:ABC-type nitrate/sulfonate/bicarbonate transport system permease component
MPLDAAGARANNRRMTGSTASALAAHIPCSATGYPPILSIARWADSRYLELAKVIRLSRFDLIRHVILPQLLRAVWAPQRLSRENAGWVHVDTRST